MYYQEWVVNGKIYRKDKPPRVWYNDSGKIKYMTTKYIFPKN